LKFIQQLLLTSFNSLRDVRPLVQGMQLIAQHLAHLDQVVALS
jgi:hypothetical protein